MAELGKTIRDARERKRISQQKLGELTGVSRSAVAQWESGLTIPDGERWPAIARALDLDPSAMLGMAPIADKMQPGYRESTVRGWTPLRLDDTAIPPLVVWRSALLGKSRSGGFMLQNLKAGETERPEFLRHSKRAFAFRVVDQANEPAYRLRDTILVNPDEQAIDGDDVLVVNGADTPGGTETVVGQLIRSTATCWYLKQYAVRGEREFLKATFPDAWPIVGRYNRR